MNKQSKNAEEVQVWIGKTHGVSFHSEVILEKLLGMR